MMAPSGNAHMLDVDGAWSDLLYSVYAFGRMMWKTVEHNKRHACCAHAHCKGLNMHDIACAQQRHE